MSARIVNVRPKPGYMEDSGGNFRRTMNDGLTNLVTGLGTRADSRMGRAYLANLVSPQQIEEAFETSPSLRKAITIPATDRVRAWRDWQADNDQIELLEAEEQKHQLQQKTKQCEILRGLGGGALILISAGDPALPINVNSKGGLVAVNVVSRWHLSGEGWETDLSSPDYGKPKFWTISGAKTGQVRIHPSRVVCFPGDPLPSIWRGSDEDRFWGRGRVPSLIESAQNLDEALATFAAMIKDALNVDIGVTKLLEMVSTAEGEARLNKRLSLMIQGGSVFNGKLYDLGGEDGKGGEKLDRHQVDWAGIDSTIRVYAEAFCAAADIPFTRFWGTSAKGLNATGAGDERDWNKMVETGQELETRPCLSQVDVALIPSALGSRPPEIWWKFSPLSIPTETEEVTRFKTWTEAMDKVSMSGAIPEEAYNEAYQNGLRENGWTPGIDAALDKIPEAQRFGGAGLPDTDETDPSALTQGNGREADQPSAGNGGAARPAARANDARFTDAMPRTLYVRRDVLPESVRAIKAWAKSQGLPPLQDNLHVTLVHIDQAFDWMKVEGEWNQDKSGNIEITPGGVRIVEPLGDRTAVLMFTSSPLSWRHEQIVRASGSQDKHAQYQPHISLTGEPFDLSIIKEPFRGEIKLGPEIFEEVREG